MENDKLYIGFGIDIKNSKKILFNQGYGTADILNLIIRVINWKYGAEISNSKRNFDGGKLFSIKEGDMIFGILNGYQVSLAHRIYHYLNIIYYSVMFQTQLSQILHKNNEAPIEFRVAIIFNAKVQKSDTQINLMDWDTINGTAISATKYVLSAHEMDKNNPKNIAINYNSITNLPFNLNTLVLEKNERETILPNQYWSGIIQLLFWAAYSKPFTEENLFNTRKILYFSVYDDFCKDNNLYKERYLLAAVLDEIYHVKSYKDSLNNMGYHYDKSFQLADSYYMGIKIKDVSDFSDTDIKQFKENRNKNSSKISKILREANTEEIENNIKILDYTLKRITE